MSRPVGEQGEAEWRLNPQGAEPALPGLAGDAGLVAFLIELSVTASDEHFLTAAARVGERLSARIDRVAEPGLFDGLSGVGFACAQLSKTRHHHRFRDDVLRCLALLEERSQRAGSGVEWVRPTRDAAGPPDGATRARIPTDLYSGAAGIGLFLLAAEGVVGDGRAVELAARTGRRLIERADRIGQDLDWALDESYTYRMPNFSHGTAGVCYFLATLARATADRTFLDAAIAGARHLQSLAYCDHGLCLLPNTDRPKSESARWPFEFGWCHGPSGTGRLWWRLYEATADDDWVEWLRRSARAYFPGAIPDALQDRLAPVDGHAYCHGLPGNADFLFGVSRVLGDRQYADIALQLMDSCLAESVDLGDRLAWYQLGRIWNPDEEVWELDWEFPQTGFLTGNAGVGMALLHADATIEGRVSTVRLPDFPFPI